MPCIFPTASSKGWDEDFHQIFLLHSKQTGLLILMSQWFSISLASCPLQDTHSSIDDLFLPAPVTGFYWSPLSLLPCPFHLQLKSLKSGGVGFAHFLLSLGTWSPQPTHFGKFPLCFPECPQKTERCSPRLISSNGCLVLWGPAPTESAAACLVSARVTLDSQALP